MLLPLCYILSALIQVYLNRVSLSLSAVTDFPNGKKNPHFSTSFDFRNKVRVYSTTRESVRTENLIRFLQQRTQSAFVYSVHCERGGLRFHSVPFTVQEVYFRTTFQRVSGNYLKFVLHTIKRRTDIRALYRSGGLLHVR